MLTPLGVLQANNWLKLNQKQSMLAIASPAAADDNWKFQHHQQQQQSNMSRPPPANSVPASLNTPYHSASRDTNASHQPLSAPMMAVSSSTGTVVPSPTPHLSGSSAGSPSKPLTRSKSRGGSVGGFVHGIVNGVQASLRNVAHKSAPSNGYHSDHPPPSKPGHFKTKASLSPTNFDSPDGPSVADRHRDQPSPVKPFNRALARSLSRGRAYESEGDNHTIGSIRHTRPSYPPISTNFATTTSGDRVAKANGHTHIPLSPLSRENSITQPITAIASALSRSSQSQSQSQSPPSPNLIPPSYTIRGPVSRSAARAILELDAIPPTELLKVLAALLDQIAAANDALRAERAARGEEPWDEQLASINAKQDSDLSSKPTLPLSPESPPSTSPTSSRSRSQRRAMAELAGSPDTPIWNQLTTASRVALSSRTATLSFHARHIPQISLEAYLVRILKYCPTANSTFVAVLVYFDRMCRMAANVEAERVNAAEGNSLPTPVLQRTESNGIDVEKSASGQARPPFAIDSYNVHRLVIAGVTVASKFFSDVFYTNSRYAKVGGLPQAELNQLELQFLLLNDFSLVIPPEELARYAAQLIVYAQGRGTSLTPEGLGKGKLGREAKIILDLEPETEPEPEHSMETSPTSVSAPYINSYAHSSPSPRTYQHATNRHMGTTTTPGLYRSAYTGTSYTHDNHSGMDITHDSETEVSTDEDSTIKARSGSESEASEWGVGSTEDEGDVDGGETETEGDDDSDEDVGVYERRSSGNLARAGSENRLGRSRGSTPGGTKVVDRRPR